MEPLSLSLVRSLSGDNSLAPFHFWWRETVLKSEKVYKWLRLYNWSNCSNSIISTQQTFVCSKSTIEEGINMLKTPEQRSRRSSGVFDFVVNFEHTLHLFLVFLLLTLNKKIFGYSHERIIGRQNFSNFVKKINYILSVIDLFSKAKTACFTCVFEWSDTLHKQVPNLLKIFTMSLQLPRYLMIIHKYCWKKVLKI